MDRRLAPPTRLRAGAVEANNGQPLMGLNYVATNGGDIPLDVVMAEVRRMQAKGLNVKLQVVDAANPNHQPVIPWVVPGDVVEDNLTFAGYFGDNEISNVRSFKLWMTKAPVRYGGCAKGYEEDNDCLWYALSSAFNGRIPWETVVAGAKVFKSKLGLQPNEPVPVEKLATVDAMLSSANAFTVQGDYVYISSKLGKATRVATIVLRGGHYRAAVTPPGRKAAYVAKGREAAIKGRTHVTLRDGTQRLMTDEESREWSIRPNQCPYTLIQVDSRNSCNHCTPAHIFAAWDKAVRDLSNVSKSLSLADYGSYIYYARALFAQHSKSIPAAPPLVGEEARWVSRAMEGGLCAAKPGVYDNAVQLDVNSCYPWVLTNDKTYLPTAAGEFQTLAVFPEFLSVGIYRVKVDSREHRFMVRSTCKPEEFFTHYDINSARLAGCPVELVQDGKPNFLFYKERIAANKVYGAFVNALYPHKSGSAAVKAVLNCLWGDHCRRKKVWVSPDTKNILGEIHDIVQIPNGHAFCVIDDNEPFAGEFPRFGPFVRSKARLEVAKMIAPVRDQCVRLHTDGFVLCGDMKKIDHLTDAGIGKLKVEHRGRVEVVHVNKVLWSDSQPAPCRTCGKQ